MLFLEYCTRNGIKESWCLYLFAAQPFALLYYISRQSVPRWNGLDTTQLTEWCAHMAVSNNSAHHSFANRNIKSSHPTTTMGNIILKLLWCLFCFYLYNCGSSSFYGTPHCIVSIKMTGILFCLELLSLWVWISMTNDEKVSVIFKYILITCIVLISMRVDILYIWMCIHSSPQHLLKIFDPINVCRPLF